MKPILAITDRLGNKGTIAIIAVVIIGTFAALDYRSLNSSPKVTFIEDAWQAYDRAALSRDAPEKPFDNAAKDLTKHIRRIDTLVSRGPAIDKAGDKDFHAELNNLRECQQWLATYRSFYPVTDPNSPNATRDNARDHIDACTDAHPVNAHPPTRGINDDN